MAKKNVEYKTSWRNEYIKWISGFANAQGGTLVIGKDDSGAVLGLRDAKRQLEDIPKKYGTFLGRPPGQESNSECSQ